FTFYRNAKLFLMTLPAKLYQIKCMGICELCFHIKSYAPGITYKLLTISIEFLIWHAIEKLQWPKKLHTVK
ncbi:MAG TPA: hypothetical protein DEB31_01135, partial [Clostridiales bacterium]|nr:hypothetical protein [Clostridiales bacterium]